MAGVPCYEELSTWQLCVQLRDEIFRLTESGPAARNPRFRDPIRDSSSSPPRNIAEGFGRFRPREFAYFVRIARASLAETKNHLQDGRTKRYFTEGQVADLVGLTKRCLGATTKLLSYLESCGDEAPTGWDFDKQETRSRPRRTKGKRPPPAAPDTNPEP